MAWDEQILGYGTNDLAEGLFYGDGSEEQDLNDKKLMETGDDEMNEAAETATEKKPWNFSPLGYKYEGNPTLTTAGSQEKACHFLLPAQINPCKKKTKAKKRQD